MQTKELAIQFQLRIPHKQTRILSSIVAFDWVDYLKTDYGQKKDHVASSYNPVTPYDLLLQGNTGVKFMVSDPDQMNRLLKEHQDVPEARTTLMKVLGEDRKRIEVFKRNDLLADNSQIDLATGVD